MRGGGAVTCPVAWRKLASPAAPSGGQPMPRFAVLLMLGPVMLGLTACSLWDEAEPAGPSDMQGWRGVSGKPPTRAEYTAMVAACQDGAVRRARAKPLAACPADLGPRRAQA